MTCDFTAAKPKMTQEQLKEASKAALASGAGSKKAQKKVLDVSDALSHAVSNVVCTHSFPFEVRAQNI